MSAIVEQILNLGEKRKWGVRDRLWCYRNRKYDIVIYRGLIPKYDDEFLKLRLLSSSHSLTIIYKTLDSFIIESIYKEIPDAKLYKFIFVDYIHQPTNFFIYPTHIKFI